MPDPSGRPCRWIIVADSPFLPANGGGESEHEGFVRAAAAQNLVAALVIPARGRLDTSVYADAYPGVAVVGTLRRTGLLTGMHPTTPYVVRSRPAPSSLARQVRQVAPHADGIVVFSYKSHAVGHELSRALQLPAVLRQHNIEGDYHRELARSSPMPRRLAMRFEAWRISRDERRLERSTWLRGIADISRGDAALRRRRATVPVTHVPPFALSRLDIGSPRPRSGAPTGNPEVLFLAALDVQTNVDALEWFCRLVWPHVVAGHDTARLRVVGRHPGRKVRITVAGTPGADLSADVPDTAPYLRSATVAVNPAVSGSGVNIKLVEYLMAELPVVTTSRATHGLDLQAQVDVEVQDQPRDFADAVVRLLQDPARAAAMGLRGGRTARRLLDPRTGLEQIGALFDAAARRH